MKIKKYVVYLLIAILLLCAYSLYNAYQKERGVIKSVLKYCQQNQPATVDLKAFTPFEWDTLYVVYGPMLSELIYQHYPVTGPEHTTDDGGITYYFILKGKVVQIEDDDDFKHNRRSGDVLYLDNEKIQPDLTTVSVIIYATDAVMKVNKRVNEENPAYHAYDLSPI